MRVNEVVITADALFNKIDALQAMIDDAATTPGEKENATALIKRLQAKLETEFPGAKPSIKVDAQPNRSGWMNDGDFTDDFIHGMAKAAKAEADREELFKNDPAAKTAYYMNEVNRLREERKKAASMAAMGDVEYAELARALSRRIDGILRNHLPEEYKKAMDKRAKSRQSAAERANKKAKEKTKELNTKKKSAEAGGLLPASKIGTIYEESFSRFSAKMRDLLNNAKTSAWKNKARIWSGRQQGSRFFFALNESPDAALRMAWESLSEEDRQAMIEAVNRINTLGYKGGGITAAQKATILNCFRPSKAPPRRP